LKTGYRYREAIVNFVEIPLYEDIYEALTRGYINETLAEILVRKLIDAIQSYISVSRPLLGNIKLILYSPYTIPLNKTYEDISIDGLEPIVPGLYRVVEPADLKNITTELIKYSVSFNVFKHSGNYYVLVKYNRYRINGVGGIDKGYMVFNPSDREETPQGILLEPESIAGYLSALARGYGFGFTDADKALDKLNKQVNRLNAKIRDLNTTISQLNGTLRATQRELGNCQAEKLNISAKINQLYDEINKYREREKQWMIYALSGTASIFVIIILLYMIASRGLGKASKR
jgi:hypothetical protein